MRAMGPKARAFASVVGSAIVVAGCSGTAPPLRDPVPEARPLGQEWRAYRAAAAPAVPAAAASEVPGAPSSTGSPTGVVRLQDALARALESNPALAASSWEVRVREGRATQASLRPNPELQAQVEDFGGSGELRGFRAAESTLSLSQLIETGGKRAKRGRAAQLDTEVAGWEYEMTRIGVCSDVAQAFVTVLAAQERVRLSEELIRVSEAFRASVQRLVSGGATSSVELTRAGVEVGTARIDLASAQRELGAARIRLAATWGANQALFERVEGDLTAVGEPPSPGLLRELFQRTPELARWDQEIARREAVVASEDAQSVPSFVASAGVRRLGESHENAFYSQFSVPFPIFDRNQGARAAARSDVRKARLERQVAEVRLAADLEAAYQELVARHREVAELRGTILPGAAQAFEGVTQGFARGLFRNLDVLDAQRRLFELRLREIDALRAYHAARSEVERITGVPLETPLVREEVRP